MDILLQIQIIVSRGTLWPQKNQLQDVSDMDKIYRGRSDQIKGLRRDDMNLERLTSRGRND